MKTPCVSTMMKELFVSNTYTHNYLNARQVNKINEIGKQSLLPKGLGKIIHFLAEMNKIQFGNCLKQNKWLIFLKLHIHKNSSAVGTLTERHKKSKNDLAQRSVNINIVMKCFYLVYWLILKVTVSSDKKLARV